MTYLPTSLTAQQGSIVSGSACNDDGVPLPPDPRASVDRAFRMLWRRKWRFLFVSVPVLLVGFGYLLIAAERYTAHATLMVGFRQAELVTAEQSRERVHGEPDIDGAIELMRGQPALRHVAQSLELQSRPEFQGDTTPLITRLRQFVATWLGRPNRVVPMDTADTVASRLLKDIKIERVGRSTLLDVAYSSPDPGLAAAIVNALVTFSSEDEAFLARMTLAERSGFQIVKTSVVSPAVLPREPSSPNTILILAGTAFCALAAALSAVLMKEFRAQQTVLSTEEVNRRGLRALGVIPSNRAINRRGAGIVRVAAEPGSAFSDSVASLHAAVSTLAPRPGGGGIALLLTSALQGDGKSTTAAALATSMAACGIRVLLVDADLRSPTLHRMFGLGLVPGLADCISPSAEFDGLIQKDAVTGVCLLAGGSDHVRPLEVLGSAQFRAMFDRWRTQYDVILIDSPPILAVGDAQMADYSVVVVRWGSTSWSALNQASRLLWESGAQIAGVTVSRVNVRQLKSYEYADSKVYGPAYGDRMHERET